MTTSPDLLNDAVFLERGTEAGELSPAAAHYIAVIATNAQRRLADGEDPEEVVAHLVETLNDWLQARGVPYYTPLVETVRFIGRIEGEVRSILGAEATSAWFMRRNARLDGRSPVDALVHHRFADVERAVDDLRQVTAASEEMAKLEEAEREAEAGDDDDRDRHAANEPAELEALRGTARDLGIDLDELLGRRGRDDDDTPPPPETAR